jgi:hypothetical protein
MANIPGLPEDFTAQWLAEVLKLNTTDIHNVTMRTAEAESGLVSLVVFLELTLAPGVNAPTKLVGKLAPTHEGARQVTTDFGLFAREENFYHDIASKVSIRSPKAYHCDHDDSGMGVLLLEDCSHMKPINQTDQQPTSLAELEQIVDSISQLASSSWEAGWLDTEPEVLRTDHPVATAYFGGIQAGYPAFLDSEFMDWVPAGFETIAERLTTDFLSITQAQQKANRSLCHLDLRLANIFLDDDPTDPVVIFDWASMYPGRTAQDLGNLIGTGYSPEFRRQHEETLVLRYHENLLTSGVENYSFDDCWLDYKHGLLIGLRLLPMALGDLDLTDEGGGPVFRKIMKVLPQAVIDHGGVELIDEVLAKRGNA